MTSIDRSKNFREAINGDLCIQSNCNGKSLLIQGEILKLVISFIWVGANYTELGQPKIPLATATIVENFSKEESSFNWPQQVAPYQIIIVLKHRKSQLSLARSSLDDLIRYQSIVSMNLNLPPLYIFRTSKSSTILSKYFSLSNHFIPWA
ncbi:hypothetical protein ACTA71_008278 [Dictyostelium dimigraforme]